MEYGARYAGTIWSRYFSYLVIRGRKLCSRENVSYSSSQSRMLRCRILVVAEPDGIQGELCDVEETSICEIPVEQRIVICCRLQCISVFRERQRQHLELDISSGEMDDFAFFQNRPVKWMIFAEWVSDIDVRLGKSEVMLRSFDGIHECVWPLTCLIHFSQLIGRNTYHSSKTRALI